MTRDDWVALGAVVAFLVFVLAWAAIGRRR